MDEKIPPYPPFAKGGIRTTAVNFFLKARIALFFSGVLLTLAFEPVGIPGLAIISFAILFYELSKTRKLKQAILNGFLFGLGFFGSCVSWIFVSIHSYGGANYFVSGLLTLLFVAFLSLYCALFTFLFEKLKTQKLLYQSFLFAVLWTLIEYIRAHLFTGFPWALVGDSQTGSPLKYLAPILGVYGLTFLTVWSGCGLAIALKITRSKRQSYGILVGIVLLFTLPQLLHEVHWTKPIGNFVPVSIIQGNISENEKWKQGAYIKTIKRYLALTEKARKGSLIIWPEGAIPIPYPQAKFFLNHLDSIIKQKNATLVAGIPYALKDKPDFYYNAMIVLGKNHGHYFKHHLVPFGEYLPADIFRDMSKALNLVLYETRRGSKNQPLLNLNGILTQPFVCYEIAYSDLLLKNMSTVKLLLTISDDAWFGRSMARAQHLQIAKMRSLESGRYQIVATNNGISAILNDQGEVLATIPSFKEDILEGKIKAMQGLTPWSYWGDKGVMVLLSLILLIAVSLSIRECGRINLKAKKVKYKIIR